MTKTDATDHPPTGAPGPARKTERPRCLPQLPRWSDPDYEEVYAGLARPVDAMVHALQGQATQGLAPTALMLAYADWALHLMNAPGKMSELALNWSAKAMRLGEYAASFGTLDDLIEPLPQDSRFEHDSWGLYPFNVLKQGHLLAEEWWHYATLGVRGVTDHHEDVVNFTARQMLDMMAPANFPATNPQVLETTMRDMGGNLVEGGYHALHDTVTKLSGARPDEAREYRPGDKVARTPGKVILRNELMELIQYAPSTETVEREPVLIVPAWIMKYYILDLQEYNSLIRWLVDQGHTVFCISWINPTADHRDIGMDDYRILGPMAALDAIGKVCPDAPVNAVGYCLGGTLLSIAAAHMAREGDERLNSISLLAAQTDFTEPGEIQLFIDESQVSFLEDQMWQRGYLDNAQMAGAFQLLNSKDLIWSASVNQYLLGGEQPMFDLIAWNQDSTRLPYRMQSEYLRWLFMDNALAEGRYRVAGGPVALTDIRAPICSVATIKDHIAPWQSVYKIHLLTDTTVTFVLTKGGHNAGIVSEPGHKGRAYQIDTRRDVEKYVPPDQWHEQQEWQDGSWWPAWDDWMKRANTGEQVPARPCGAPDRGLEPLCDAPGEYVLMT